MVRLVLGETMGISAPSHTLADLHLEASAGEHELASYLED